jgi:SAM-dependent methyltransferase
MIRRMGSGITPGAEDSAARAYDAIAPVYDEFTAHHDYELWLGNLLPALNHLGLQGTRLLDVGCGTGKSFLPMLDRGWAVTACDVSPAMLAIAQGKARTGARLFTADMRSLPALGDFDLVWALDDAVNYLLTAADLRLALASMGRNLAPRGLLVFDLNTLATYREFFAETSVVERNGTRMTWHGQARTDAVAGSICEAHFEVDGGTVPPHIHRQRHFPESEVRAGLRATRLECLAVFGHGEDAIFQEPLDEARHTKAIYVARAS